MSDPRKHTLRYKEALAGFVPSFAAAAGGTDLTPEDLVKLSVSRPLTADEQKKVDAWRTEGAAKILADMHQVDAVAQAAIARAKRGDTMAPVKSADVSWYQTPVPGLNLPVWQVVLGAVGVVAVGAGVIALITGSHASPRARLRGYR